jgi:hypothetical protein
MRTNLALYAIYGLAVNFLLAMASFSKYAPTNHQTPVERPPAISHGSTPASYVRGTTFVASNGIRYAFDGKALSSYSAAGNKIFAFGDIGLLTGSSSGDAFLASHADAKERTVRKVSPDGKSLWEIPQPGLFPKAVVSSDEKLFYADTTGLYAFSPKGQILWRHDLIDKLTEGLYEYAWHFVVIGPDGTLYVSTSTAKLVAFSLDGRLIWTLVPSPWGFGAPVFGAAGQIYAPSGNNLVSIDRTGHVLWRFTPPGNPMYGSGMTPVLGKNGDLYVTAWTLYCVSPEGKEKWRFHPDTEEEYFDVVPAVDPDGTLYLASSGSNSKIYAISPDGKKRWVAAGSSSGYGLTPFRYTADGWMWRTEFQHVTGFPVEQHR